MSTLSIPHFCVQTSFEMSPSMAVSSANFIMLSDEWAVVSLQRVQERAQQELLWGAGAESNGGGAWFYLSVGAE